MSPEEFKLEVHPMDEYNQALISNVHPPSWTNPKPKRRYNLVVMGAGTAGLISAAAGAALGARVALIEKNLLGGDCLNVGCVPSKCLIRSSRVVAEMRDAQDFGIKTPESIEVAFGKVMERMRRIRAEISTNDSAKRYTELGVDVFLGEAKFLSPNTVEVDGKKLRFKKAIIATGARAVAPPLPGLKEAGFLTNETIFNLTELPKRLGVIGAGPIGAEMAQTFRRLGAEVTVFNRAPQILAREDQDAARLVEEQFKKENIRLVLGCNLTRVEAKNGEKIVYFKSEGKEASLAFDEILVGVGRAPNVDTLELEKAGVQYDKRQGVVVSDTLQTTNKRIYAGGDICLKFKFTHTAEAAAKIAIQNALFFGKKKVSDLIVPWCTYTDPEIAHVGLYRKDAEAKGIQVETITQPLKEVDRALVDGEENGFVRIHLKKGTDKILGATIVARHAGEMISEVTLAITNKIGLSKITEVIHPYPTQAEGIKRAATTYNRTRLKPWITGLLKVFFAFRR